MSNESKLVIPAAAEEGMKALMDYSPSVAKKLAWRHVHLLIKPLLVQMKELKSNAAFFRCCALSGEIPEDGDEPYPQQTGSKHG